MTTHLDSKSQNPGKGTNGRYSSPPNGDRFRDLITRRESAGITEENCVGIERV
jgi:hypothetical protein